MSLLLAATLFASTPSWESALQPLPPEAPSPLLQLDDPGVPDYATHANTRLIVASRTFDEDVLDDIFGSQLAIGIEHDRRTADSGPGWEGSIFASWDDESDTAGTLSGSLDYVLVELMLGARYTQRFGGTNLYGYVAGGADLALIYADAELSGPGFSLSDDDTEFSLGGYAHAGAYWQAGGSWSVGVDVRHTFGTEYDDLDIDHLQIGVSVGTGS